MSFEISELMVQLIEAVCQPGSTTKAAPQETPACRDSTTKAPAQPICQPPSTTKAPTEKPDVICSTSTTKAAYEDTITAGSDLEAVRAQLRERLAAVGADD
jgi:hypothetical protein